MTTKKRQRFVEKLTADFRHAKDSNSQDVAVWMNLAYRYAIISANMNFAFCVRRAQMCRPVMHMVTDMGMAGSCVDLTLVPVAVETE